MMQHTFVSPLVNATVAEVREEETRLVHILQNGLAYAEEGGVQLDNRLQKQYNFCIYEASLFLLLELLGVTDVSSAKQKKTVKSVTKCWISNFLDSTEHSVPFKGSKHLDRQQQQYR
jgi:hypothetical protein